MDRRRVGRRTSWRTPPRQIGSGAAGPGARPAENKTGSFDQWLDHRLREMYGAVVEEPLPRELSELVERLNREGIEKRDGRDNDEDRNK